MKGKETRREYGTIVGKGWTRTVTFLFFGLFHYFITFAYRAQNLVFWNFRLACIYGRLLLGPTGHDKEKRKEN